MPITQLFSPITGMVEDFKCSPTELIALGLSTTYGERHLILFNQVLAGTLVLMILSSITLYFGQGDGMKKLKQWKQKRLEKKVIRSNG